MAHPSSLGSPPEFSPDGTDPPLTSPPIVGVDRLAAVRVKRHATFKEAIREAFVGALSEASGVRSGREPGELRSWTELRRFRSWTYWQREPQTIQLAPGVSTERSVSLAVGLTHEQARTLARTFSLSASADLKILKQTISERWSDTVGEKLVFQTSQEHVETLRLENPNSDPGVYRRFAVWTVVHDYAVDRLDGIELTRSFAPEELEQLRNIPAIWSPVAPPIKVTAFDTVVTSSIDVPRGSR